MEIAHHEGSIKRCVESTSPRKTRVQAFSECQVARKLQGVSAPRGHDIVEIWQKNDVQDALYSPVS
jgi:hypothetical protein